MAYTSDQHRQAYFLFRQGLRFAEIAERLEASPAAVHRWSTAESNCQCPWHDWNMLKISDSDENHRRAMTLFAAGHSENQIAAALGVQLGIIEEWKSNDYPCQCGSHGWAISSGNHLAPFLNETSKELLPIPITTVEFSQENAINVALEALSTAVRKGDVAPRSWRDVLDTLKTVHEIINSKTLPRSLKMKETTSRSVEIPGGDDPQNKLDSLSKEIFSMAIGSSKTDSNL